MTKGVAEQTINFIKKVSFSTVEKAIYGFGPDAKDNYLFDLALQNNCVFIISDDWKLTSFVLKPVPVHSSKWFLKTFPI